MSDVPTLASDVLELDPERTVDDLAARLRHVIGIELRRRGAVVGLSGGVDSAVTCALCVHAVGAEHVVALFTPETDSEPESLELGRSVAQALGVEAILEDITPILAGARCYERRDAAVQSVLPDYEPAWRLKIALPSVLGSDALRVSYLVAAPPGGDEIRVRLTAEAYRAIVAATNFKQRTRKMIEYYHADRLDYAVAGTPNRLEYDQGFFVKTGDGAADVKPIAHLYKTQVYALAEYLDLPKAVRSRLPTTDTYSLPQSQEEFYFSLPYDKMDLCLYAHNHGMPPAIAADATGLSPEDVERVYRDIEGKRRATRYLHLAPLLLESVPELDS